jgi:integrase
MPSVRLNDLSLRSLKPPPKGQTDFWDSSLPSFGCRVSQGGTKTFLLKHRNRRITLGRYPVITLQHARGEAKRLLAEFTLGRLRPQSLPYSQAVKLFLADKAKTARPRTLADYTRMLDRHFPFKGQLIDVMHAQIAHRLDRLKDTPSEHNHARTVAMIFFNWCKNRRYVTDNPVIGISPYERKRRTRVLSDAELKCIWRACEGAIARAAEQLLCNEQVGGFECAPPLNQNFATIVQLLILLGQRETETASFQKSWIDLESKTVTIPEHVAKNGNEHCFPCGGLSISILSTALQASRADILFPARGHTHKPFCGWGKAKAALDELSGVSAWTLHDIRRTFRTNLGKLGVAPHIAERLVNHISARTDMERTYDLHRYLPEMREAIEKWDTYLTGLIS